LWFSPEEVTSLTNESSDKDDRFLESSSRDFCFIVFINNTWYDEYYMRYQHNIIERVLFIYHYHNSSIFNSNSIPDRIVSLSVGSYFIFINIALAMLRRDKPLTDKINDIIA